MTTGCISMCISVLYTTGRSNTGCACLVPLPWVHVYRPGFFTQPFWTKPPEQHGPEGHQPQRRPTAPGVAGMALPAQGIIPVVPSPSGALSIACRRKLINDCAATNHPPCATRQLARHANILHCIVVSAADPPINSLGETTRRHYVDDANFALGMSRPGAHLQADSGMGRVHFPERRGTDGPKTGTKHIEFKSCTEEFRNKQKRHGKSVGGDGADAVLVMDRKRQTYLEDGTLLKDNQNSTTPLEQSMGRKKTVTSARNGIPYTSGGDKPYPSPEYAPGFYDDYAVPSSAAWATQIAREARADPTKHAGATTVKAPQRMTWKLRTQLEAYEQDMGDVGALPQIACDEVRSTWCLALCRRSPCSPFADGSNRFHAHKI